MTCKNWYDEFAQSLWHHQIETISLLLFLCVGNSQVTSEFPSQRPVTRSFDVFFDLRLNKCLSKQSWGWWFETPSCSLWRHCNGKQFFQITNPSLKFKINFICKWDPWIWKLCHLDCDYSAIFLYLKIPNKLIKNTYLSTKLKCSQSKI